MIERVDKLHLELNRSGQYLYDVIEGFFKSLDRELAGMFNPLDTGRGMAGLLATTPNDINTFLVEFYPMRILLAGAGQHPKICMILARCKNANW